jgi:glycosyltransferase involved in cell wall biosynthesis
VTTSPKRPAIIRDTMWSLNGRPRISVIIPALNEEPNLRHILPRLPTGIDEVVLVDAGSTDRTIEVALALYPATRVVRQRGRGKGAALEQGLEVARGDIIVTLDADGSHDPDEIRRFVRALLGGADYAKGSRFLRGGGSEDITRFRAAGNWVLTRLVNLLFRTRYSDLCYGYNAFWATCGFIARRVRGFEVETAMNIRAAKAGLTVVEVPSLEWGRVHGVSNLNAFRDGSRVLTTVLRERFSRNGMDADLAAVLQARAERVRRMQPSESSPE